MSEVTLSTVTPVYAGKDYLLELVGELSQLRDHWQRTGAPIALVEAVFVDDSSQDGSLALLQGLCKEHPWIRVVTLSRNYGQHPCTVAGILHTCGDWVVTLDEDLQHHPKYISELIARAVMERLDVVYAKPQDAVHQSLFRDAASKASKLLLTMVTSNPHIRKFNSFRLIRGSIARAAASVCGFQTYLDVALCWYTNYIDVVYLPLQDQRYIETKRSGYNLRSLFSHARRLIISTETKVLRAGAAIGVFALGVATFMAAKTLVTALIDSAVFDIRGWTSLFLSILFFGGLTAFLVGVALEYITAILLHTQGKPTFFTVDRQHDESLRAYFGDRGRSDNPVPS